MTPSLLSPPSQYLSILEVSAGMFYLCGKRQDNPLLLLGQYSDDELNEEADKIPSHPLAETSSPDQTSQAEDPVGRTGDNVEESTEGSAIQPVEQVELKESSQLSAADGLAVDEVKENCVAPQIDLRGETYSAVHSEPWTSDVQITGDVIPGWKVVIHDETNQYYYWNTETGETSWEIPAILAQGTNMDVKENAHPVMEEKESIPSNVHMDMADGEKSDYANLVSEVKEKYMVEGHIENKKKGEELEVLEIQQKGSGSPTTTGFQDKDEAVLVASEQCESETALSTRLLSYAESLLQRLKSLERSSTGLQGHDWIVKYILEIEIRLSDFKALLVHGSSLMPFWLHSEEKLRGLEYAIDEFSVKSRSSDDLDTGYISTYGSDDPSKQSMMEDSKLDGGNQATVSAPQNPCSSPNASALIGPKESQDKSIISYVSFQNISPNSSPTQHSSSVADGNLQVVDEAARPVEVVPKAFPIVAVEDVDMDVDMDVDDEITAEDHRVPGDASSTECFAPSDNVNQPNPTSEEYPPLVLQEDYGATPPPDEDWIPPPPPDSEPIPPPPPDEPPLPEYPIQPAYLETVQLPYTEHYNMSYPVSGYEYYGPTPTEVPKTTYYAEGSQITESQPTSYFDAASSRYSEASSVMINSMESLVYYSLPNNGTVSSGPVYGSLESSGFYGESGSISYHDTTASDLMGAPGSLPESVSSSLVNPVHITATVQATATIHDTTTGQTTATVEVKATPTSPLTTATSLVAAPAANPDKTQSKVMRSKKRTIAVASTLRSNKKVSSLVDKWKAAKDELHEDEEDEPETAYELLEKKRQREIEKWRTQQIASGEAKENANFQPLGGDWRERVKRKRARTATEAKSSLPDTSKNEKQQPNLTELSRDLPSGWQAYWDESSKEVYYGNLITSETTWTRPTR